MYSFDKTGRVTGPGVDFEAGSKFEAVLWCERLQAAFKAGAKSRRGKRARTAVDRARMIEAGIRRAPRAASALVTARRNQIARLVLESLECGEPRSVRALRLAARCKHEVLFDILQLLVSGGAVMQIWWGMRPAGYRITPDGERLLAAERASAEGTPDQAGA